MLKNILLVFFFFAAFAEEDYHTTPEEIDQEVGRKISYFFRFNFFQKKAKKAITYGATIRLVNLMSNYQ